MLAELPHARNTIDPRFLLWVSPVDDRGCPVDPVFIQAAERIGGDFLRYRCREINDSSRAMELAERAVHRASRAKKKRPVEDPVAYLFRTFTNLVDEEIERGKRFLSLSDEVLHAIGRRHATEEAAQVETAIFWRETLDCVDETMRWVLWRLYWGFSVNEIAEELRIPPNTLSKRLSRARKCLKKTLDRERGIESKSVDAKQSSQGVDSRGVDPRRGLPSAGADRIPRPSEPGKEGLP